MNNQTVKDKVADSFAAYFKVWTSQINITVVASTHYRRALAGASANCTIILTISNMSPIQASAAWDIVNSRTALTQLTQVVARAGPAVLASVTVARLWEVTTFTSAPIPTHRPTSKPANQAPTVTTAGGGAIAIEANQL